MPPSDPSDLMSDTGSSRATVLNPTILIPAHHQKWYEDNGYSEQDVLDGFARLRDKLEKYLDPNEEPLCWYRGIGANFNGAGGGMYVFGATDRRFVLLDADNDFEEVNYDAVTEITSERGKVSFSAHDEVSIPWRPLGIVTAAFVGSYIITFVGSGALNLAAFIAIGSFVLLFYYAPTVTGRFLKKRAGKKGQETEFYPGSKKVIIRTPTSTETDTTVHANVNHFAKTADITVNEETSERYVLRQWTPIEERFSDPPELGDVKKLPDGVRVRETDSDDKYPAVKRYGGDEYDEPDLSIALSKIVREHR